MPIGQDVRVNALAIPPAVTALLGPTPRQLTGYGESVVLTGRGKVAKVGPATVVAREARILGDDASLLPLDVPALVDSGDGWLARSSGHQALQALIADASDALRRLGAT